MTKTTFSLAHTFFGTALVICFGMSSIAVAADTEPTSPEEQLKLCDNYWSGEGVEKDEVKALKYCEAAATQGDPTGQWATGRIYWKNQKADKALTWFEAAGEQGHKNAQWMAGQIYERRASQTGHSPDFEKQMYWYKKLLYSGVDDPQNLMYKIANSYMGFEMTFYGEVSSDGYAWFHMAALYGHEGAAKTLKSLEPQIASVSQKDQWDGINDDADIQRYGRYLRAMLTFRSEIGDLVEVYGDPGE